MAENKSLELAADVTKSVITLATGAITITVTFVKEFRAADKTLPWPLKAGWVTLLLATMLGVWTLLAIVGSSAKATGGADVLYGKNIQVPAALMLILFAMGVFFAVLVGFYI